MSTEAAASVPRSGNDAPFNVKEELVLLIRGFFATPILSALARLGAMEPMWSRSSFGSTDFPAIRNTALLEAAFAYLRRAGLLEDAGPPELRYRASELGKQIFRRWSSFLPPHSYKEYLHHFHEDLQTEGSHREVDRFENILGSGRTHERFFPSVLSFIKRRVPCDLLVDVGCGDGQFLEQALRTLADSRGVGVDLSPVSTTATHERLEAAFPTRASLTVVADVLEVEAWSTAVARIGRFDRPIISMWFVLHEIADRNPGVVIQFLNEVRRRFPSAHLLIGELVRNDAALLAQRRRDSIMPEYLLFHDLSGQGPLTWSEYRSVLAAVPYSLAFEQRFDEIAGPAGREPATFVWVLKPQSDDPAAG